MTVNAFPHSESRVSETSLKLSACQSPVFVRSSRELVKDGLDKELWLVASRKGLFEALKLVNGTRVGGVLVVLGSRKVYIYTYVQDAICG